MMTGAPHSLEAQAPSRTVPIWHNRPSPDEAQRSSLICWEEMAQARLDTDALLLSPQELTLTNPADAHHVERKPAGLANRRAVYHALAAAVDALASRADPLGGHAHVNLGPRCR